MKTIYDLKLHETMDVVNDGVNGVSVMRVSGGWIYTTINYQNVSTVFVPDDRKADVGPN